MTTTREMETTTLENDESTFALMARCVTEVFEGNTGAFDNAFAEAMAQQIIELSEANDHVFEANLSEELADAMRGVLLQWLGEHPPLPREELPALFLRMSVTC